MPNRVMYVGRAPRSGQSPSNPIPYTLALTSHGMDMALHHRHLTNQQQNNRPPCPGACPCSLDAPHADPSHQGPLPWPQSPVPCRPAPRRTPCGRARTGATPAGTHPTSTRPTTSTRATLPSTPLARALASLAPHDADHGRPHTARVARAHAAPLPCPPLPELAPGYKSTPDRKSVV